MKTKIIYIFILFFAFTSTYGQEKQEKREEYCVEIAFTLGSSALDTEIGTNKATLVSFTQNINKLLQDSTVTIEKITITSKASPEGGVAYNKHLTQKRSNSVKTYIKEHINIPENLFVINNIGTEWKILQDLVAESNIEKKSEVIYIINNVPEETWVKVNPTDRWLTLTDSRNKHLMDLHFGIPYRQMEKDIFPEMRSSSVVSVYYRRKKIQSTPKKETIIKDEPKESKEVFVDSVKVMPPLSSCEAPIESRPLFALKTNLAQLGVGVTNLGVEFRLSNHISLDLPIAYSPYTIKREWKFRVLAIQPEVRFWPSSQFKGHFFGLHIHGGYFNISYNERERFQNDNESPLLGAGLSYGYFLDLTEHLGLEFNIGAGYANIQYDTYYNMPNGDKYDSTVKNYWGITRVGITLEYRFHK